MILVRAIAPADGWDDAALAAAQPATPKRYRVDTRATLRRQIAFDRTPYYIVASCFAEQSNIQGAVAQLVERFVRIEEVAVSTTVGSTKPAAFIPPQRAFSLPIHAGHQPPILAKHPRTHISALYKRDRAQI